MIETRFNTSESPSAPPSTPWIRQGFPATPLVLPQPARSRIVRWAWSGHPLEVCGLLIGRLHAGVSTVEVVERARNLETQRAHDRFVLAPDDWLAAEEHARECGREVLGFWHSHPDHPARPSRTDFDAAWEGYSYLIASITRAGEAELRCWQLFDGAFVEQPLLRGLP